MTTVYAVMVFGAGALVLFALVYFFFDRTGRAGPGEASTHATRRRPFNITFARLFSLMTVGVLGVGLALSDADAKLAASGFTLLGTIAGYLAGAKATTVTESPGGGKATPGQPPVTILGEHL